MDLNVKHEEKIIKKRKRYLVAATVGLAILSVVLTATVYIPFVKKIYTSYKEIKELKTQRDELAEKVSRLNSISDTQLKLKYEETTERIPEDINLGRLGEYISSLVAQADLNIVQLSLTEEVSIQELTAETQQIKHTVRKVHIPLQLEGSKEDLLTFINLILSGRYILDFDEIQLSEKTLEDSDETVWILRMQIVQHTIPYVREVPLDTPLAPLN